MGRKCKICVSDDRDGIEGCLVAGTRSWNEIAKKFGVSWRALQNHARNHMAGKPAGTSGAAAVAAAVFPPAPTPSGVKGYLTPGTVPITAQDIQLMQSEQSYWSRFLFVWNGVVEEVEKAQDADAKAIALSGFGELRRMLENHSKIVGIATPDNPANATQVNLSLDVSRVVEAVRGVVGNDPDILEEVSQKLLGATTPPVQDKP